MKRKWVVRELSLFDQWMVHVEFAERAKFHWNSPSHTQKPLSSTAALWTKHKCVSHWQHWSMCVRVMFLTYKTVHSLSSVYLYTNVLPHSLFCCFHSAKKQQQKTKKPRSLSPNQTKWCKLMKTANWMRKTAECVTFSHLKRIHLFEQKYTFNT